MRLERDYNETEKDNEKVTRLTKTMMSDWERRRGCLSERGDEVGWLRGRFEKVERGWGGFRKGFEREKWDRSSMRERWDEWDRSNG